MTPELTQLQQRIGYTFKNVALLELALTHPSLVNESPDINESNQRLEYLGDAVLQLVLSAEIYRLYPTAREGVLTQRRKLLVEGRYTASLALELGMDACLRVQSKSSELTRNSSALEDAFEALVAAVFIDSNYESARDVILSIYGDLNQRLAHVLPRDNPKGRLQELVQPEHGNAALRYEVTTTTGEAHAREYTVTVYFKDEPLATGCGSSKKLAEEAAAQIALANWQPAPSD